MFRFFTLLALMALTVGQYVRPLVFRPYPQNFHQFSPYINNNGQRQHKLCTYSDITFEKCIHTVAVARNSSIPLALECIRKDDRENCINSVESGTSDMVVLTGHGYKPARSAGLRPFIYAHEDDNSLYIAVAPRNITFLGIQEAPIIFDQSKHRAFHAATFFNYRMGHDICNFLNKASLTEYINIVDSSNYIANYEEILICPNRVPDEFENYKRCNVEAGLQRAVFVSAYASSKQEQAIRKIFDTIFERFGTNSEIFNFFDTFQGQDDVIFKNSLISFDSVPTYRNQVDENVFNYLHCNEDEQPHDPRELL
ncbi:transferrin-like [Lucilia cuprina]|uniref:transferrin-like n=1 Tax=Lucilia cuprina TaxID=7375 RepID=UPI001F05C42B|nr:transferrin-like [Lucilia cuprina]